MRRIILLAALLSIASVANAAGTLAERCEAAKKQEAGKYAACRLKAEAKLVSSGDMDNFNYAVARCATKLTGKYSKLENDGACPTVGDAASIISFMATCSDTVVSSTTSGGSVPICGDSAVNAVGEQCDGAALGGEACTTLGFASGLLACSGSCEFNTAGCVAPPDDCGNGTIESGEDCDQGNLNGGSCAGQGFADGALECTTGCVYDTSECYAARFVDNANGTITDHESGLMWEKKVKGDSTPDVFDRQDSDNVYPWSGICANGGNTENGGSECQPSLAAKEACLGGSDDSTYGCFLCASGLCNVGGQGATIWQWLVSLNDASFAGHDDWRIPVLTELESIRDMDVLPPAIQFSFRGASCGTACTNLANPGCSCTVGGPYWSTTTYHPSPNSDKVVGVSFLSGFSSSYSKTNTYFVRAVRGGSQ